MSAHYISGKDLNQEKGRNVPRIVGDERKVYFGLELENIVLECHKGQTKSVHKQTNIYACSCHYLMSIMPNYTFTTNHGNCCTFLVPN